MFLNWFIAIHVISILSWMAALFYLPRLLIYHMPHSVDDSRAKMLAIMERRLLKIIATPAMLSTLISGGLILILYKLYLLANPWFFLKILFVVILIIFHLWIGDLIKRFSRGERPYNMMFYRLINEFPPIFSFGIVVITFVKIHFHG